MHGTKEQADRLQHASCMAYCAHQTVFDPRSSPAYPALAMQSPITVHPDGSRPQHAPTEPERVVARLLPRFIKAEANLLRLPLFALGTKGLRTLDAIECRGTMRRNGETHDFWFQAARNAKTPYPGPLSRAAHLAFLSIATDHGFPIENPISWSWRELCRRMGLQPSGREVRQIKAAITEIGRASCRERVYVLV